ncbi:radical SAM protein [Desulfosarcina sp. OttesenSCG-928-G10]|nr:radical SAM protein [Desulfosarcina sp. OttesenSCG-928-G10]
MNKLVGVCWSITSNCNLSCPVCCRYIEDGILDLKKKKKLIDIITNSGVKKITISGGEPLLEQDFLEILSYSRSVGLKTSLATNGLLLSERILDELDYVLDELQPPLDGHCAKAHSLHRGSEKHYYVIIDLLQKVLFRKFNTDISTVVTLHNHTLLPKMKELLTSHKINKWKLFQFLPISYGLKKGSFFYLSDNIFESAVLEVKKNPGSMDIDYGIANNERLSSYFNISPIGNLYLPCGSSYSTYGNVFEFDNINNLASIAKINFDFHYKRFWREIDQFNIKSKTF